MAGLTFRGLDPRTSLTRWGLFAVAVGIVIGGTAPVAVAHLEAEFATRPENIPWHVERITAFLAYLALAGSVTWGLLVSTRIADTLLHRPVTVTLHKDLAAIGLGLAAIHGALLGLDHSMPFSTFQIAVPFAAPYAPAFVALGQVGLYLMVTVVLSFYVRGRLGPRAWRRLHYLSFLAFAFATAHGIGAGTDTGNTWAAAIYVGASTIVAFLLAFRVTIAVGTRLSHLDPRRDRRFRRARSVFEGDPALGRPSGDRGPGPAQASTVYIADSMPGGRAGVVSTDRRRATDVARAG